VDLIQPDRDAAAGTSLSAMDPGTAALSAQEAPPETRQLLELHSALIAAHLDGDVDRWMAIESMDYVSANGGRVTFPAWEDRRRARESYLESTEFEVYRDVQEPVVRISEDGSLGWLIAEVEVRGVTTGPGGERESFHDVWAWVELYQRTGAEWKLVGNVSNRRPGGPDGSQD
jgi:hypothetical protein